MHVLNPERTEVNVEYVSSSPRDHDDGEALRVL